MIWSGDTEPVLGEIEEFLTGTRSAAKVDSERILATVLFVDVVGSTAQVAALGDKRWMDALGVYYSVVRRQLDAFGGHEVKTTGDGVLARFDGPARAIRCARASLSALAESTTLMRGPLRRHRRHCRAHRFTDCGSG